MGVRIVLVVIAVYTLVVSADLVGTARQHRDDRRCAGIAQVFRPHGISVAEQRVLSRKSCSADGYSTKVYQA